MPYRIKARSDKGHTVTRLDLDYTHRPIQDKKIAQQLADDFASTRSHGANGDTWWGIVEHYTEEASIANPLWRNGAVLNPLDKRN
jgi:hypothetical protein